MILMTIIFMIAITLMGACFSALSKDHSRYERRQKVRARLTQFASQ